MAVRSLVRNISLLCRTSHHFSVRDMLGCNTQCSPICPNTASMAICCPTPMPALNLPCSALL